jgi:tripartite-type tricarboxylate transporter receptor subunit TctC
MKLRSLPIHLAGAFALGLMAANTVAAEGNSFPARPVVIVVPFSAGGGSDVVARMLAQGLSTQFKQPVIVENRPGASGNIGAEAVARAKPDGYTLLFGSMGVMSVNRHLFKNMPINPEKDLAAAGRIYDTPHVIEAGNHVPYASLQELVEGARKQPGKLTFGSAGMGTSTHLVGELFMHETNTNFVHVPYKGNAPALNDVIAGHVDVMFDQATNSTGQIRAGKLKVYAVTSENRLRDLPNIPTVAELGFPKLQTTSWTVLAAPAATPVAVLQRLSEGLRAALADATVRKKIEATGAVINFQDYKQAQVLVANESQRWGALIKSANISVD